MKKNYLLLLIFLLLSGCAPSVNEEGMSIIVNKHQINIHFKWKDKELQENNSFSIILLEKADWSPEYTRTLRATVTDGKLALCIRAVGRELSIEDLYLPAGKMRNPRYDKVEESSSSWEIEPLLDDYVFYLDDYIVDEPLQDASGIEPLELCNIIDKNTDETFNYSLLYIYSDEIQYNE